MSQRRDEVVANIASHPSAELRQEYLSDMEDVKKLKALNFDSWADFYHHMARHMKLNDNGEVVDNSDTIGQSPLPVTVARGIQEILQSHADVDPTEKHWLSTLAVYESESEADDNDDETDTPATDCRAT